MSLRLPRFSVPNHVHQQLAYPPQNCVRRQSYSLNAEQARLAHTGQLPMESGQEKTGRGCQVGLGCRFSAISKCPQSFSARERRSQGDDCPGRDDKDGERHGEDHRCSFSGGAGLPASEPLFSVKGCLQRVTIGSAVPMWEERRRTGPAVPSGAPASPRSAGAWGCRGGPPAGPAASRGLK